MYKCLQTSPFDWSNKGISMRTTHVMYIRLSRPDKAAVATSRNMIHVVVSDESSTSYLFAHRQKTELN